MALSIKTLRALQRAARGNRVPKSRMEELEMLGLIRCIGSGSTMQVVEITAAGEQALKGAA